MNPIHQSIGAVSSGITLAHGTRNDAPANITDLRIEHEYLPDSNTLQAAITS